MTRSLHRRSFINNVLLFSVAPLAAAKRPQSAKNPTNYHQQIFKNIKPLDQDFVSVNGWVLPKETLIKGTS
jgi:hypothetical protein